MSEPGPAAVSSFLEYVEVARRRWLVIVVTAVFAGIGAYLWAQRATSVYQASTEVLLQTPSAEASSLSAPAPLDVATEIRILRGYSVQQAVQKTLPNAASITNAFSTSS